MKKIYLIGFLLINIQVFSQIQYFGQNKPRYKTFDFRVAQSSHFELYHYFDNLEIATHILQIAEKWHQKYESSLGYPLKKINPIILYNNSIDFQETRAVNSGIAEGTSGITESFKNRIIFPIQLTEKQTEHIFAHELVHAFQYQLFDQSDSLHTENLQSLPLFLVEGLAEYLSLGNHSFQTEIWLKDAVIYDEFPKFQDLTEQEAKYFPYRWGHAFWIYFTEKYGNTKIIPFLTEYAQNGSKKAFFKILHTDSEKFTADWKSKIFSKYATIKKTNFNENDIFKLITDKHETIFSPTLSPNGKLLAYISIQNHSDFSLFIADIESGKILKKLSHSELGKKVDAINFVETGGCWSPDNRKFALVVQSNGKNKLCILDIQDGKKSILTIPSIDIISNPSWSPDGNQIAFSSLSNGISDIFTFHLKDKICTNLTKDTHSDIQPIWSNDGKSIYFVSDRNSTNNKEQKYLTINKLSLLNSKIEKFQLWDETDNTQPQIYGDYVYFLSDIGNTRNIYRFKPQDTAPIIEKLSNFETGILGTSIFSPALTIASNDGKLGYIRFQNHNYHLSITDIHTLERNKIPHHITAENISSVKIPFTESVQKVTHSSYKTRFKLDYLGNSGIGINASRWGTGLGGGIIGLFSDMLGNNQVSAIATLNGELQDFGAQIQYLNQKKPLQWGISLMRIPYRFSDYSKNVGYQNDNSLRAKYNLLSNDSLIQSTSYLHRLFINQIGIFGTYPLSKSRRFEFGASFNWYNYSGTKYVDYYKNQANSTQNSFIASQKPEKLTKNELETLGYSPFSLQQMYLAYVGDNSIFGNTAPIKGHRYRFEFSQYLGNFAQNSLTVDYRNYFYRKPFTLATRVYYFGRFGASSDNNYNKLYPMFVGYPWYMHGFWGNALRKQTSTLQLNENYLRGTKMALTNFEIRLPITADKNQGFINFPAVKSDFNLFVDIGMAWANKQNTSTENLKLFPNNSDTAHPLMSIGSGLRINLFNYLIIEPFLAFPIYDNRIRKGITGINFLVPGW